MSFTGKVVLVTGASSGIGAAVAVKFAEERASVAITGRNEENLKNTYEECKKRGGKSLLIVADVTKDDDIKRIINDTIKYFGKLDVLVNNAGAGGRTPIDAENAMEVFDRMIATNLRSAVYLTSLSVPHLAKTKGNIINISSIAAKIAGPTCMYGTSKAGMDHFSRCIALELAPKGIRVNIVNPGPVKTNFFGNSGFSEKAESDMWKAMKNHTPLNKVGDSQDIVNLVLFLASDDMAKSITGASFVSDNGFILKGYPAMFSSITPTD